MVSSIHWARCWGVNCCGRARSSLLGHTKRKTSKKFSERAAIARRVPGNLAILPPSGLLGLPPGVGACGCFFSALGGLKMVIFVVFVVFHAEGQLQDVVDASEMHLRSFCLLFLLGQEPLLSYVLSAQPFVTSSFGPFS